MNRWLLPLAAAGALVAAAPAQVTRSGAGYLLRIKYTKGQVIRLTSTNTIMGMGGAGGKGNTQFIAPMELRVLAMKANYADIKMTVGEIKLGSQVVRPSTSAVVQLNNRNQPIGSSMPANIGATLPLKPIKIGQTWTGHAPISSPMGQNKIDAVYRFAGVKAVGGQSVAVISYTVKGLASGVGTMTLLAKDGTLFTNDIKLTMSAGQTPITVVSKMKRV